MFLLFSIKSRFIVFFLSSITCTGQTHHRSLSIYFLYKTVNEGTVCTIAKAEQQGCKDNLVSRVRLTAAMLESQS